MSKEPKSIVTLNHNGINTETEQVRTRVAEMAIAMERRLAENDHKPGWEGETKAFLHGRAEELLHQAWEYRNDPERYITKLIDVANYCMMAADNAGGIKKG